MIYVIHGDDALSSYKKLQELTENIDKVTRFDCEKGQLKDFELLLDSQELFADKKIIIIENPKKIPSKQLDEFATLISKFEEHKFGDVYIYCESVLDDKFTSKFKKPSVLSFFLPKLFFQLLDNISPNSYKKAFVLLNEMKVTTEAEQIFYAVVKRIRYLILIKIADKQDFPELSKMAPWQRGKLHKQADLWTLNELLTFYKKLYDTEIDLKTSGIANSLSNRLDNLIASAVH